MSRTAIIIVTAKVRPGATDQFTKWKAQHDLAIGKAPGFVGSDITPPRPGTNEWTILLNFRSKENLVAWQTSPEHAALLAEVAPILEGELVEVVSGEQESGPAQQTDVTEVIFSKIKVGMEDAYREWATRMQAEQAKVPGYKGTFLQHPEEIGGVWTTIMRFDSADSLGRWMNSPNRKAMLREAEGFIEHEQFTHLATSFPGWVPIDPTTGKGPPNWKTSFLVLLGLFPMVMLELKFLSPILKDLGLTSSPATFVSNVISVFATSFLTMPLFIRWFGWWLFPVKESPATNAKGILLLAVLFAAEITLLWKLLPW